MRKKISDILADIFQNPLIRATISDVFSTIALIVSVVMLVLILITSATN